MWRSTPEREQKVGRVELGAGLVVGAVYELWDGLLRGVLRRGAFVVALLTWKWIRLLSPAIFHRQSLTSFDGPTA